MLILVIGIICILFCVFVCLPFSPLYLWPYILEFLKGGIPVLVFFIGLVGIFVGIADIKDKKEAKKDEEKDLKNK